MDKNSIKKYAVWARRELIARVVQKALQYGITEKEKTERELLMLNKELVKAKTEALQAAKRNEEMFQDAIKAMGIYSGEGEESDYEEDYDYDY